MTSIDATCAYAVERASRLSAGAQRVLMALLTAVLLQQLLLPNPLLNRMTGYAEPGGVPLLKIHFYSYTLFLALLFVLLYVGLVGFLAEQCVERPGVVQFAAVVVLCATITIARQGIGGVAYMVDTLFAAPLGVMLAFYLNDERRQRLTAIIIYFVTLNAIIGIAERLVSVHLFNFPQFNHFDYFRATALMGHPLENAFITSSVMFLVPAMPWSAWRKLLVLSVCTAGILAFGARSSFGLSIVIGITAVVFFGARELLRGEMRLSTLAAAPWIAVLSLAVGIVLTFGTVLGERIVQAAKFDESAQARVHVFRLFRYLSTNDLLYGVDFAEVGFLLKTYKEVDIIENCWIAILLMLGAILFVVFVPSLLGFFRSIGRGRGAIVAFAALNFLLVASTNNSISTKTPSLAIFAIAVIGLPTRQRQQRRMAAQAVFVQPSPGYGGWS
jgi:hypothetical protein